MKQACIDLATIAKLRAIGRGYPPVAARPAAERAMLVGPVNSAGQAFAWARALELADRDAAATSMAFTGGDPFGFQIDQDVYAGYAAHSPSWQRRQFEALQGYDAVLVESARPLVPRLFGADPARQIREFQSRGLRAALLFHGSDIRDPDRHIAAEPHSHFAADPALAQILREVTARSRELISEAGIPVFVSTPDLLDEVAGATWLPVVVEPERWRAERPPFEHGGPHRVAHIPSKSTIKGTELALPTLRRLHEEGRIDFRTVTGIPHREMPAAFTGADIVVEQFRVGNYTVTSCEAMAAGRLLVSHVSERVRERTRELTGEDLPIVEAVPETIEEVLADIAQRPERYAEIAARGPGFVQRHHSGERSGRVLAEWLAAERGER